MVFIKSVVNADAGTADKVGGNDWDILDSYFDDTDITPKIAKINTITKFRSSKHYQQNPANTFSYITVGSAITANRNETIPLLTGADTRVYESHPANLANKTLLSSSDVSAAVGGGTPSNIGSEGLGMYKQKTGSTEEFYNIASNSEAINLILNPGTNSNLLDVDESALDKDNMQGGVFLRLLDELNIVSSSAEEEIFSCLIPAGKMETNKVLRLTINGDYLGNSGTPRTLIVKVKFGATTLWADTSVAITNDTARRPVRMVMELANRNDVSSQVLGGVLFIGTAGNATTGLGDLAVDEIIATTPISGVATEDTDTDDLFLKVTIQHAASESTTSYRRQMAILEVV